MLSNFFVLRLTEVIAQLVNSGHLHPIQSYIIMETRPITISLDLSHNLYRVEDGKYEIHLSLFTEPKKGILVWQEVQQDVLVRDGILKLCLGANRPVRNLIWVYQLLYLEIDFRHKDHKVDFDHRFKIRHIAQGEPKEKAAMV